jgi:hypothetical protein
MSWTNDLRKLRALSWQDRWLLLEAFIWSGVTSAAMASLPFRWVASLLGLAQGENCTAPEPAVMELAERIGWAMRVAAARIPWKNTCLCQALTGTVLLRHRGIPGTLYLAVAKDKNLAEKMTAHAWLRCGENILTGAGRHEQFTVIATFAVI